jgi:OFA family oxalate/formate antiporter-like MFS transporter
MRWRIAVAGTAMQLALGAVYAWSVFRKPLAAELHASVAQINLAFTTTIVMLGVGAFVGGLVLAKLGPRAVGIAAGVLYGTGTYLAGFAVGDLPMLYLTYGAIAGFGIGLGYIVPIATLVKWFPERRGLITGIAVAGFGCGALAFGPIARVLIAALGPWQAFKFLGLGFYTLVIGSALVLRDPPGAAARDVPRAKATETTLGAALHTWQWYALWALLFLNVTAGIAIIAEAAPMAQELGGATELQATALVGTIAVFNGAGRFVWSALSDAIGRRAVFVLLFAIQAVVFAMLPHAPTYAAFLGLCCAALLCYGGGFGTMPAFVTDYFGSRHVGKIYGLMLTAWGAGAVLGPMLVSRMRDLTGNYVVGLQAIAGIMLVSSIAPILLRPPRNHVEPEVVHSPLIADWPTVLRDNRFLYRRSPSRPPPLPTSDQVTLAASPRAR